MNCLISSNSYGVMNMNKNVIATQ